MAENELTVIRADGQTKTLRSSDLGGGIHAQHTLVSDAAEVPVAITGGLSRHNVDSSPAVALDPPTAAARFARLRVYETVAPGTPTRRLYYRQDGVNPLSDGTNAQGYLLHGEMMLVRLADFTAFRMIGDSSDNGIFEVYVEYLNVPTS